MSNIIVNLGVFSFVVQGMKACTAFYNSLLLNELELFATVIFEMIMKSLG